MYGTKFKGFFFTGSRSRWDHMLGTKNINKHNYLKII